MGDTVTASKDQELVELREKVDALERQVIDLKLALSLRKQASDKLKAELANHSKVNVQVSVSQDSKPTVSVDESHGDADKDNG